MRAAVLVIAVILWSAPALGQEVSAAPDELKAAQVLELADRAAGDGRTSDAEALYRLALNDREPTVRAEARFRLAMLQARLGRLNEAAVNLRQIVDEHPDAQRARLELAAVLARLGEESAARRELRALRSAPLSAEIALALGRFDEALRARQPVTGSFSIALAPDSNINRATRSDTLGTVIGDFNVLPRGQARSGVGLALAGSGQWQRPLSDAVALFARAHGSARLYRANEYDDVTAGLAAGPIVDLGGNRIELAVGAARRWYGGKQLYDTFSLSADFARPLEPTVQLRLAGYGALLDYHDNRAERGGYVSLSVGADKAVDASGGFGGTVTGGRRWAGEPALSHRFGQLALFVWRDVGRATVTASVVANRLVADERLALFAEPRRDFGVRSSLGLTLRHLTVFGFAPGIELVAERNDSTVGIYRYRRLASEFFIRRAF